MLTLSTQQVVDSQSPLTFTLGGFTNPNSGRETGSFEIHIFDQNAFDIATSSSLPMTTQMTLPQIVTTGASLSTDYDIATSPIVINIQFTIANDLYPDSNLIITYPPQLASTLNETSLKVTSPQSTALYGVTLNQSAHTITGLKFFSIARSAGSLVQLRIEGFKNPVISTPTDPFIMDI